jgi:hypothetical protein
LSFVRRDYGDNIPGIQTQLRRYRMFGKSFSEYVSFQKVVLWLIAIAGVGRLALSLAGVSNSAAKFVSITIVTILGALYVSVKVHTSGFGSYKRLLALVWIQSALAQLIVAVSIVLGIVTHKDNIFTTPEYSGGGDGKNWGHVGAHLVIGFVVAPLVLWLIGSLVLLVTRMVAPREIDEPALGISPAVGKMVGLGVLGFFIGGFVGFLLRPSGALVGQLPFGDVINRGANLKGLQELLLPLAQTSFNYLLAGAVATAVIGMTVGYFLSKHDAPVAS